MAPVPQNMTLLPVSDGANEYWFYDPKTFETYSVEHGSLGEAINKGLRPVKDEQRLRRLPTAQRVAAQHQDISAEKEALTDDPGLTALMSGANMATFGGVNWILRKKHGADAMRDYEALREKSPWAALAGDVAGAAPSLLLGGGLGGLVGKKIASKAAQKGAGGLLKLAGMNATRAAAAAEKAGKIGGFIGRGAGEGIAVGANLRSSELATQQGDLTFRRVWDGMTKSMGKDALWGVGLDVVGAGILAPAMRRAGKWGKRVLGDVKKEKEIIRKIEDKALKDEARLKGLEELKKAFPDQFLTKEEVKLRVPSKMRGQAEAIVSERAARGRAWEKISEDIKGNIAIEQRMQELDKISAIESRANELIGKGWKTKDALRKAQEELVDVAGQAERTAKPRSGLVWDDFVDEAVPAGQPTVPGKRGPVSAGATEIDARGQVVTGPPGRKIYGEAADSPTLQQKIFGEAAEAKTVASSGTKAAEDANILSQRQLSAKKDLLIKELDEEFRALWGLGAKFGKKPVRWREVYKEPISDAPWDIQREFKRSSDLLQSPADPAYRIHVIPSAEEIARDLEAIHQKKFDMFQRRVPLSTRGFVDEVIARPLARKVAPKIGELLGGAERLMNKNYSGLGAGSVLRKIGMYTGAQMIAEMDKFADSIESYDIEENTDKQAQKLAASGVGEGTAGEYISRQRTAMAYLKSKIPPRPQSPSTGGVVLSKRPRWNEKTARQFFNRVLIASSPQTVMIAAKNGSLTPEMIETVKAIFPEYWSKIQEHIKRVAETQAPEKGEYSPQQKYLIAKLLELKPDRRYLNMLQGSFGESEESSRGSSRAPKMAERAMPEGSESLGRV